MIVQICFFIFEVLFIFSCHATVLSKEDSAVLKKCLRVMLEKSEGGYVLLGKKPVCINGFQKIDYFLGEQEKHFNLVCLRESASIIRKMNLNNLENEIILHVYSNEDYYAKNYIHLLFINKNLFLTTVQSNLSLFQYVLGPDVTPIKLLEKLTDPGERFHAVLKNDKVLIGILLGYGTQNALFGSRFENIEEAIFAAERPPFRSKLLEEGDIRKEFKEMLLMNDKFAAKQDLNFDPSFGHNSLHEEMQRLLKKMEVSSKKLVQKLPMFVFGRLKENNENNFISDLEETQDKISDLLNSNNFLPDVLKLINKNDMIEISLVNDEKNLLPFNKSELKQLDFLVAASIWNVLKDEDVEYRTSFIKGMSDANSDIIQSELTDDFDYRKLKALSKAQNSIKRADEFFSRLNQEREGYSNLKARSRKQNEQNAFCLTPFKLYYKVEKNGFGLSLADHTHVTAHYTIKSPEDEVLSDTWSSGVPSHFDLAETIPGFAMGMKGMKIGEIREIFIHPDLAYGIYTTLKKGIYLKVRVQLLDFESKAIARSIRTNTDIDGLASNQLNDRYSHVKIDENEIFELEKKAGYSRGHKIWQHFKKCDFYTLSSVINWIEKFQAGESADVTSEKSQELINRLHWNVYMMPT